jgi:hypothetical protein
MGLAAGVATILLFVNCGERLARTRAFRHLWVAGLALIAGVILMPGQMEALMTEFVAKNEPLDEGSKVSIGDAFQLSRLELIDQSMENFRKNPMMGIGFGAPSSEFSHVEEFGGITISARAEKGFLPAAILEETGIIGALWVSALLFVIVATQLKNGSAVLLWPMLAGIMMNLGEAMFFAMGGLGLFVWMMIGLACLGEEPRQRSKKRQRRSRGTINNRQESPIHAL